MPPSLADVAANLTPAPGRQDHTTSPSASALCVQQRLRVHRIPPRVNDDGQRPSRGTGRRGYKSDLGCAETGIFLRTGLDRSKSADRSDLPVGLRVDERMAVQLSLSSRTPQLSRTCNSSECFSANKLQSADHPWFAPSGIAARCAGQIIYEYWKLRDSISSM